MVSLRWEGTIRTIMNENERTNEREGLGHTTVQKAGCKTPMSQCLLCLGTVACAPVASIPMREGKKNNNNNNLMYLLTSKS